MCQAADLGGGPPRPTRPGGSVKGSVPSGAGQPVHSFENPMAETQTLTHSRMACNRACPRRHWLRYEQGIVPEEEPFFLRVGSAFHYALEQIENGSDPDAVAALLDDRVWDDYDRALVVAMVEGHLKRWAGEPFETVAVEQVFRDMPIINPDTGATTPVWTLSGKMDRIVRLPDSRKALWERKTTSRDISPGSDYWVSLEMDQQLSIYALAARHIGYDIATVIYDVTLRPALRPLKATPEESRKYTKAGALYANQRDRDETPEEFYERVAADIAAKPDKYFVRQEIARFEDDLVECMHEVWMQQLEIRQNQRSGYWRRNPGACFTPFRCDYVSICRSRDLRERTPFGFKRIEDVHPELEGPATE